MGRILFSGAVLSIAAFAGDAGVPPRVSSGDYPVHGSVKGAVIAAAIVPSDQVAKMFSSEIAKQSVVVEVAIYPENAQPFEVASSDFSVKMGRQLAYAERPQDVAPWRENRGQLGRETDVTTQAGVIYQRSTDPVNGTRQTVGTYSGVAVSDHPAGPLRHHPRRRVQPTKFSAGRCRRDRRDRRSRDTFILRSIRRLLRRTRWSCTTRKTACPSAWRFRSSLSISVLGQIQTGLDRGT